jgi:hypothetical protein
VSRQAVTCAGILTAAGTIGDAVVIEDGKIARVTWRSELGDLALEEYPGATILPPLIDAHLHPLGYAGLVTGTSLKDATDIDDLVERLAVIDTAGAIIAQRFDDTTVGRLPTRHDLDRASPDRPILTYRYCGHIAVANTTALDAAGIGPTTPDPPGGSLDRDTSGIPTGVLRETAIEMVTVALDPLVMPPTDAAIVTAMRGLVATGLSRVVGIAATDKPLWCGVGNELETLCRLATDIPLDIDVVVIADTPGELRRAAADIASAGGRLRFWGWKDFADGSLGGHTAAMWSRFMDEDTAGTLRLKADHAAEMAGAAFELGGVAAIHAIGDRAIDETLDVFDRLIDAGADPGRLRIEHLSVASDDAIHRLSDRGIVASVQPPFLTSEAGWLPGRLGPQRNAYRFATMEAAGVRLIAGSDCPVERPDPLTGIAAAVHRSGWDDGENISVESAVGWYTEAPAAHLGLPPTLRPGSPADFVVVQGMVGSPDAEVAAVYRGGVPEELNPVEWPG